MKDTIRFRSKLIIFSLFFGFIGILSKVIYRPLVIDHNINDFGISGFAPSLFATTAICLLAAFSTKIRTVQIMIFCSVGILFYETEQIWTSRTFDLMDILATLFGLTLAILIYKIQSKRSNPEVQVAQSNPSYKNLPNS